MLRVTKVPVEGIYVPTARKKTLHPETVRALAEAHVAATPGRDFDPLAGHRYMRFSYAGSHEDMALAMDRIERWLR